MMTLPYELADAYRGFRYNTVVLNKADFSVAVPERDFAIEVWIFRIKVSFEAFNLRCCDAIS
jgi:hypothetical protein